MEGIEKTTAALKKYMPHEAAPIIAKWIHNAPCQFRISRKRSSKFGDYRAPYRGEGHRISVNHDLNPYAFLVTTVHEFAHLKTWNEYKSKVKPHGEEWKSNFKGLMQYFFRLNVFPQDIHRAITNYMNNPAATSCSDLHLFRALQSYDKRDEHWTNVEHIPQEALFAMENGRVFRKGNKLRKRYQCVEAATGRIYLFSPVATVRLIKP
ncbi:hypothetical protein [Olivibacter sitiensis]|uniref:hypothetical protein n=1 Tax=Olivibacter sitiensis TaxID=376470 RepID=UPI0004123EFF|nr:hypothetical protein [Olivibacter sitiensis]